jgi:SH3-like domain-containing protein
MRPRQLILAAAALACASSATAQTAACNLDLNITDQDPAGLNVRASPGGAVLTSVKAKGLWVQVEVTGQSGAWARIKSATRLSEDDPGGTLVGTGVGWVAFSKGGIDHLDERTRLRDAPNDQGKLLLTLEGYDDSTMPRAEALLGCDGDWLKLKVKGATGWTQNFCSNELTTCV